MLPILFPTSIYTYSPSLIYNVTHTVSLYKQSACPSPPPQTKTFNSSNTTDLLHELQPRVNLINDDRIRVCVPVGTRLRHYLIKAVSVSALYCIERERKHKKRLTSGILYWAMLSGCSYTLKITMSVHSFEFHIKPPLPGADFCQ